MKASPPSPFRLRHLLNPFYLARRYRELRDYDERKRAFLNVFVYLDGRCKNAYSDLRGVPRLLAARSEAAYYKVRGLPGLVRARAASARSARESALSAAPMPAAPLSFADRDPISLLRPEAVQEQTAMAARFQAGAPFKHLVIDGLLDPEFCGALVREFPPYEAAVFRNEKGDLGKAQHQKVSELGPSYRKLDLLVQTPEFLRLVSSITGIPNLLYDPTYMGGGAHENLEEMELDPHVDFTVHNASGLYRRVNLLLYLNPEWDESWGGALELHVNPWLRPEQNEIRTVAPLFNRCVLFETSDHSWHGFRAIRLPPDKKGLTRRSFALYLYTRAKPQGFPSIPADLTVFVDRPLPAAIRSGLTLNEEDVRVLRHLVVRRDWKLRYLYDRAITLYNDWRSSQAETSAAREALARAEEEKSALANDLRLCRSQLRESLEALLRADAGKPPAP